MRSLFSLLAAVLVACVVARPAAALDQPTDARAAGALRELLAANPLVPDGFRDFALKPWAKGPAAKLWVGAALPLGEEAKVITGVFREEGEGLQLLAHHDEGEPLTDEPLRSAGVDLDLLPYRIGADEVAFGVVVSNSYNSTARNTKTHSLQLYRYHGKRLSPIFAAITYRNNYKKGRNEGSEACFRRSHETPDCVGEETVEEFAVVISPHETKGFFDLLLKSKAGGEPARYVWNGSRYEQVHE